MKHGIHMDAPAARTLPALLAEMANRYPDQEFVVDGERRRTYAAFQRDVRALAAGLLDLGLEADDKVAILMGNQLEWLVADFAIVAIGGVMVSINTWATGRELAYMLEHSDARALIMADQFASNDYVAILAPLLNAGALPGLEHIIRVQPDARPLERAAAWETVVARGLRCGPSESDVASAQVQPEDVAYVLYTSGSTATPKGVQLQHYALVENMWHIGERQHLKPGDRLWLAVSLFWGLGCENALFALMTHAGAIVLQRQFDASEALALIEHERCTVIYATPNMIQAMTALPMFDKRPLSTLRTGLTIGTPEQIRELAELGPRQICNIYGLTETYGNCAVTDADAPLDLRCNAVGQPLPGVDMRIVNPDTGVNCPAGTVGEIRVRGYVTCGYLNDAARNAAAFDEDGYFLTGDLGLLDAGGYLYFRGRLKEMIKTGGINVAPVEVEEVLMSHPGVALAFVVPLPDAERDEIVAALIVAADEEPATESSLRALCIEALAAYKRPRQYQFVSAAQLPLTSTGKVRKQAMPLLFERS
ncbi:MAG: AMP-binding protein [Pseudomonadota bacterium]